MVHVIQVVGGWQAWCTRCWEESTVTGLPVLARAWAAAHHCQEDT